MTRAIGFYAGSGSCPLDPYTPNPWVALSMARLLTSYTGNCIRVRRSSDSTELDIPFLNGVIDTAALASFVGANSAYVVTFYDQSGAGNNFGQATTSKQPRVVNAGAFDGKLVFDGTDDCLVAVNNCGTPSGVTVFARGRIRSTAARQMIAESDTGTGGASGTAGTILIDFDNAAFNKDRAVLATSAFANLAISNSDSSEYLNNNVNAWALNFAGTAAANQAKQYTSGVATTQTISTAGTVSTSALLTAAKWQLGARNNGASLPAALDLSHFVIYEATKTAGLIASISAVL